ncbi:MAG: peptidylprolyl isomerase [Alphaproteobacteria bacterium]|jgi:peptidyl-prolyl cis-trans isomerase SurA|nr:peptidylprolyl isomerase [Alphaproteobacteria bacterium]
MMKKIKKALCLCALGALSLGAGQIHASVNRVAAMVNHKVISTTDLKSRVRMAALSAGMPETADLDAQLSSQILNLMIEEQLQQQMADKIHLKIEDERVDQAIQEIEQRNQMQKGQLLGMLQQAGIPARIMRDHLRAGIAWVEYIRAMYGDAIQTTALDVKRKLDEIKAARLETNVLLSEIVLPVDASFDKGKARVTAQKLATQIQSGVPFPALATQFSSVPSAAKGGDRGWVSLSRLDPAIRQTIEHLPLKQVSQPIETSEGIALFVVRDRRAPGESLEKDTLITFQQVLFPARKGASQEELYPLFMRAKSFTENTKSCALMKKSLGSDTRVRFQEVQKASVSNLPDELYTFLSKLGKEKASQPVMTDLGFMVFMVCDIEQINPGEPTEDEVKDMLRSQELQNIAQRELRNLRSSAFIDIRL